MFSSFDQHMMQRALSLAEKGWPYTAPNPLVGCVITEEGSQKILSEGYHQRYGELHAERLAIQQAACSFKNATLYVNLEPCCHHGKTPPCTDAIIAAGIRRVVVANVDPNPLVQGKGIETLRRANIQVDVGLCAEEGELLNRRFFFWQKYKMPYTIWKYAMSLDGQVALPPNADSKAVRTLSGNQAQGYVHGLRHEVDAIVVGAETVRQDDPSLTTRHGYDKQPIRIVVSRHAKGLLDASLFDDVAKSPVWIFLQDDTPQKTITAIQQKGAQVITYPSPFQSQWFRTVLAKKNIRTILLEGGPTLASIFLKEKAIQEIQVLLAPKFFGALQGDSVPPLACMGAFDFSQPFMATPLYSKFLGNDLLYVLKPTKEEACLQDSSNRSVGYDC